MTGKRILILQHEAHEPPGFITKYLEEYSHSVTIASLWKDESIPSPDDFDALIILGGSINVSEGDKKIPLKDFEFNVVKKVLERKPVLGIGLGCQILAHILGTHVHPNMIDGIHVKEVGLYDIELTDDGRVSPFFLDIPSTFKAFLWHSDTFEVPEGALHLAESGNCTNQVFSKDRILGIQFHLEYTPEIVREKMRINKAWMHKDTDVNEVFLLDDMMKYKEEMRQNLNILLGNFLKI